MFDGWSSVSNIKVLGCVVTTVDKNLNCVTKCVGNFRIPESHTANDVCRVLSYVTRNRICSCCPNYFLSDSVPNNKEAFRKFMVNEGGIIFGFHLVYI